MEYLPLITLGILPSLIWLFYFLEKDKEPEPKMRILLVFIFGVLGAGLAASIQSPVRDWIYSLDPSLFSETQLLLINFVDSFFVIGFLEESVKLLAVLTGVFLLGVKELDEPVDFIIYMITAGLGFAALENYIYFSQAPSSMIAELVFLRFAITTLFHGMVAGVLGYFLALSVRLIKKSLVFVGLIVITFFHTLYNVLIELMTTSEGLIYPISLLLFLLLLTILLVKSFKETKKMKGLCKPEL
ncbi:MAG: PrsW family intramembrane metalloprotease [Patescibacteria group bacterium]